MEKLKWLATQRRMWVVVLPLISFGLNAAGIPITTEFLQEHGTQVTEGVMSLLAAWSLFQPKPV